VENTPTPAFTNLQPTTSQAEPFNHHKKKFTSAAWSVRKTECTYYSGLHIQYYIISKKGEEIIFI
jgi:prolyl oligopeptidase PreP (S9A serine peptidase family)